MSSFILRSDIAWFFTVLIVIGLVVTIVLRAFHLQSKKIQDFLSIEDCVSIKMTDECCEGVIEQIQIYKTHKKLKNPFRLVQRKGYRFASNREITLLKNQAGVTGLTVPDKNARLQPGERVALIKRDPDARCKQPLCSPFVPSPS